MVNKLIIIRINGVKEEELHELKDYLDNNYWDWKEITEETINQESKHE
tara:strand:+ start:841 stop:984 length:144 start_codon:yes stop_codon:yes gene_type:complete